MTSEQIEQWKKLVDVARKGIFHELSDAVIVDLALLQSVEKLLLDKIPGWNQSLILPWWHSPIPDDAAKLEKEWEA